MKKLLVQDKGFKREKGGGANYSNYIVEGFGLTLYDRKNSWFEYHLTGWVLKSDSKSFAGRTVEDLMSVLKKLCKKYKLTQYTAMKKDVLVIYTNRLRELHAYLKEYITSSFNIDEDSKFNADFDDDKAYFQVLNFIEFRKCWDEDKITARQIQHWAYDMWTYLFYDDKKVYLTPNSVTRNKIKIGCKKTKCTFGVDIFPSTLPRYKYYKKAAHGGICYFDKKGYKEGPIKEYDLTSAYTYCYTLPLPITKGEFLDKTLWDKTDKLTIGTYRITFKNTAKQLSTIKDVNDKTFDVSGEEVTQEFKLTSVDLQTIKKFATIINIECDTLIVFEAGQLPKEYLDVLVGFFIKKQTTTGGERAVWKTGLNGISGNSIKNIETSKEFDSYNHKELVPQWGAFIISYCRQIVCDTGLQLKGWYYSDTDCVFCKDTEANTKIIDKWNEQARNHNKELCEKYGYPYEVIKDLGTFKVEADITRMKVIGNKHYCYETTDHKVVVKAAGCDKKTMDKSNIFDLEEMPIGQKECAFVYTKNKGYARFTTKDKKIYKLWLVMQEMFFS